MAKWKLYVESDNDDGVEMIEIDSNCTFLEFRKKAADALGLKWEDLVLAAKHEYDKSYNSKTLEQMHQSEPYDIKSGSTFYSIVSINGGTFIY